MEAWQEVEALAREVAEARQARWLSIAFAPEDTQFPWMVAVDEGYPERDATTYHAATLQEALRMRLDR